MSHLVFYPDNLSKPDVRRPAVSHVPQTLRIHISHSKCRTGAKDWPCSRPVCKRAPPDVEMLASPSPQIQLYPLATGHGSQPPKHDEDAKGRGYKQVGFCIVLHRG